MEPITRKERYLAYLAGDKTVALPQPITREERYLAAMCGMDAELPQAVTRADKLMDEIVSQSAISLQPLKSVTVNVNGTTNVVPDDGYDGMQNVQIDVAVPDSVIAGDFQIDQDENYITDALQDIDSPKGLANQLLFTLSDVFITLNVDIRKGETNLVKGLSLNYNFSKMINYLDDSTSIGFRIAEPKLVIESYIPMARSDNKWMIKKHDLYAALIAIKDAYEGITEITDTEIGLNNIHIYTYMPDV